MLGHDCRIVHIYCLVKLILKDLPSKNITHQRREGLVYKVMHVNGNVYIKTTCIASVRSLLKT